MFLQLSIIFIAFQAAVGQTGGAVMDSRPKLLKRLKDSLNELTSDRSYHFLIVSIKCQLPVGMRQARVTFLRDVDPPLVIFGRRRDIVVSCADDDNTSEKYNIIRLALWDHACGFATSCKWRKRRLIDEYNWS